MDYKAGIDKRIVYLAMVLLSALILLELRKPTILELPGTLLAISVGLGLIQTVLLALRAREILKLEVKASLRDAILLLTVPSIANYSVPGNVGIPAKAVMMKKMFRLGNTQVVALMALEIFYDLSVMAFFSAASACLLFLSGDVALDLGGVKYPLAYAAIVFFALIAGLLAVMKAGRVKAGFRELVSSISNKKPVFLVAGALTLANYSVTILRYHVLFVFYDPNVSALASTALVSLSNIVGYLSPMPGGLGVMEAVMALLSGMTAMSPLQVISMGVFIRLVSMACMLVLSLSAILDSSKRA